MPKARWPVASSDADFAPYLDGRPEASVAMFGRFIDLARAAGPVIFELQNGPVVLRGTRRIFASARIVDAGLAGHINLMPGMSPTGASARPRHSPQAWS